jgi:hypothetical protein
MTKQDPRRNPARGTQLRLGARVRGSSKYVTRTYEERKRKSRAEAGRYNIEQFGVARLSGFEGDVFGALDDGVFLEQVVFAIGEVGAVVAAAAFFAG